jgi:hypothetical protein
MHQVFRILAAVVLLVGLPLPLFAQQSISTGTITGVVQDAQSLAVPGATVVAVNEQTKESRSTISGASGNFNVPALLAGRYTLRVTLSGFRTVEQVGIQLRSNETFNAGMLVLAPASVGETVTVIANSSPVETATAVRTSVLEASSIESMVARGRDPVRLLNSLPGVDPQLGGLITGGTIGTTLPTIQGTAQNSTYVAVDGVGSADGDTGNNNGITSIDAISEVRVVLNSYSAEYGRNTGPQINVVTKSGTNKYAGSLSGIVRHEALNSNTLANERLGVPKPIARYYVGVGTLGGPVWLPGRGKEARTFFFYTHEQWDTNVGSSANTKKMPTALERAGDFSQTTQTNGNPFFIKDPNKVGLACSSTTGGPGCFDGNKIPANRINPLGLAILNLFPLPNFFDDSVSQRQYNFRDVDVPHVYRALDQVTLDHNFSGSDHLQVKYRHWRPNRESTTGTFGINSNWNQFRSQYAQKEDAITINYTRSMTSRLVSEFSFGFRNTPEVAPVDTLPDPISKLQRQTTGLGTLKQIYSTPHLNDLDLIPTMTFGGLPGTDPNVAWDDRFPIDAVDRRYTFQDNMTWVGGKHLVKAGIYFESNLNSEGFSAPCFSGCLDFTSTGNNAAQNQFNTNHPYANALLGYYTQYQETNVRPFRGATQWLGEWFVQDSWKVKTNFTLELGVRFSTGTPWKLKQDGWKGYTPPAGQRASAWLAGAYNAAKNPLLYQPACAPPATTCSGASRLAKNPITGQILPNSVALIGQLVPGSGDFYNGMIFDNDSQAFDGAFQPGPGIETQPRFGFAWDVFGNGHTAIRGGYGISKQLFDNSGNYAGTFPSQVPVRLAPILFYGSLSDLGSVPPVFSPASVTGWQAGDPGVQVTHNFSVEVQQTVGFGTVVTAAYVGNRQRGLLTTRNRNLVPEGARFQPSAVDPTSATGALLNDSFLRPIPQFVNVTERTRDGFVDYNALQVTANHRLSKGLAFGTAYTLATTKGMTGALTVFLDPTTRVYGYTGTDRRHILSFNASWNLPNTGLDNVIIRGIADGWQLAGVGFVRSGLPASVGFSTTDASGTDTIGGGDPTRVTMVPGCNPILPSSQRTEALYFNTACFARTPKGSYGDAPVNGLRQPGDKNLDLSMTKTFQLHKAQRLQLQIQAYNVLSVANRLLASTTAQFDPAGNQVSSTFGTLALPTDEARQIEIQLKYRF